MEKILEGMIMMSQIDSRVSNMQAETRYKTSRILESLAHISTMVESL